MTSEPLNDADFDRLSSILGRFHDQGSMNIEQLDGFLTALVCRPDNIPSSEVLRAIWGDHVVKEISASKSTFEDFLSLLTRHRHAILGTLRAGDVYLPLLLIDDNGTAPGNDWAKGFVRGMELRNASWTDLLDDQEHGGSLIPILALAHEHDSDPEMRPYPGPISAEQREKLIVGVVAGVMRIYRYFRAKPVVDEGGSERRHHFFSCFPQDGTQ